MFGSIAATAALLFLLGAALVMVHTLGMTSPASFRRVWRENASIREAHREALKENALLRRATYAIAGIMAVIFAALVYLVLHAEL